MSDTAALARQGTSRIEPPGSPAIFQNPKLKSLEELQYVKPLTPPFFKPTTDTGRPAKRVASSEIKKMPKDIELGISLMILEPFMLELNVVFFHFLKDLNYVLRVLRHQRRRKFVLSVFCLCRVLALTHTSR